jgi:hypothetical protein
VAFWPPLLLIALALDKDNVGRHDWLAHSLVAKPRTGRYSAWD